MGKITVRLTEQTHEALKARAKDQGRSLNGQLEWDLKQVGNLASYPPSPAPPTTEPSRQGQAIPQAVPAETVYAVTSVPKDPEPRRDPNESVEAVAARLEKVVDVKRGLGYQYLHTPEPKGEKPYKSALDTAGTYDPDEDARVARGEE